MKKVQESPWLKGAAVIVLLASALLSGLFGSFVLRGLPYQIAGSWQYTDSFYRLLQERQAAAAALWPTAWPWASSPWATTPMRSSGLRG